MSEEEIISKIYSLLTLICHYGFGRFHEQWRCAHPRPAISKGLFYRQERMRAQIAITRSGVTQASDGKAVPEGGVLVRRTNGEFLISLHRKVSETALIQLMRTLRALDADFEMSLEASGHVTRRLSRQEACLRLALRGLNIVERANEPLFMSNLDLFDSRRPPAALRSENMTRLANLQLDGKDAPTALLEVSAAEISNLVLIGQNRSMRLYFLALPEEPDWPTGLPGTGVPLDDSMDTPAGRWLSILYEAAFSIQQPLFHHGFVRVEGGTLRPFQRFVYPITPRHDPPANYRVLSTAEILDSPDLIIV